MNYSPEENQRFVVLTRLKSSSREGNEQQQRWKLHGGLAEVLDVPVRRAGHRLLPLIAAVSSHASEEQAVLVPSSRRT